MAATTPANDGAATTTTTEPLAVDPSPFAWADGFMDMISKYDRASDRQLFVHRISVSRCPECRQRIKAGTKKCENCKKTLPTHHRACKRCGGANAWTWCHDCDTYFCETCHTKPHVLMLGGSANKHKSFPTDNAPGRLLHHGTWSEPLLAMAKNARRAQMKLVSDLQTNTHVPATQQPTTETSQVPAPSTSANTVAQEPRQPSTRPPIAPPQSRQSTPPPTPTAASLNSKGKQSRSTPTNSRSSSPVAQTGQPQPANTVAATAGEQSIPIKQEPALSGAAPTMQSRKRKSPTIDLSSASDSDSASHSTQHTAPIPEVQAQDGDVSALYARVRQMHSKRPSTSSSDQARAEPNAQPATIGGNVAVTPSTATVTQPVLASQAPSTAQTSSQPHAGPQQLHRTSSMDSIDSEVVAVLSQGTEAPPAATTVLPEAQPRQVPTPRSRPDDDPLRLAYIDEYDRLNNYIFEMNGRVEQLDALLRKVSQNVSQAAEVSRRIHEHRKAISIAEDRRQRALAKVIIFSHSVRTHIQSLPPHQLYELPHVLNASHKKCREQARMIQESQARLQQLRTAIENAVSSADVTLLAQMSAHSQQIPELEQQIRDCHRDRDNQFQIMVQFSQHLRDAVRTELAQMRANGRS